MYKLSIHSMYLPNQPAVELTDKQWAIVANYLHVVDASFFTAGIFEPQQFPKLRHLILRVLNSETMLHFFNTTLEEDGQTLLTSVLDLIVTAANTHSTIIWDRTSIDDIAPTKLSAGEYVIGDLCFIVPLCVPTHMLEQPTVFVLDGHDVFSYPADGQVVDNSDYVYNITSAFAIVPKSIAMENFVGREIHATQDFNVWFADKVLRIEQIAIDLNKLKENVLCYE